MSIVTLKVRPIEVSLESVTLFVGTDDEPKRAYLPCSTIDESRGWVRYLGRTLILTISEQGENDQ